MHALNVSNDLQWMIQSAGRFQVCGRTAATLPAGAYTIWVDNCGNPIYQARDLQADAMIEFPNSLAANVLDEVERFWGLADRFARLGFLHRRGYLFFGKQGCGKSSLIHQIVTKVIGRGHVAFFCDQPHCFGIGLDRFRQVEPKRPVVCVFEDVDAIVKMYGDSVLLQILDGNQQVNMVVNLASTNYPERLDKRIIARPRRFDRLIRIGSPDALVREAYFGRKLPELERSELARWVEASEGLPFAALTELVISVACLGNPLDEAATLLRELDRQTPLGEWGGANGQPPENAATELFANTTR
jgi:ATPase family associated with various cellular activities (AAA)